MTDNQPIRQAGSDKPAGEAVLVEDPLPWLIRNLRQKQVESNGEKDNLSSEVSSPSTRD